MQAMIGKQLRSLYESVLAEPLPDRIVDLLVKLDDVPVPIRTNGSNDNGQQSGRA